MLEIISHSSTDDGLHEESHVENIKNIFLLIESFIHAQIAASPTISILGSRLIGRYQKNLSVVVNNVFIKHPVNNEDEKFKMPYARVTV